MSNMSACLSATRRKGFTMLEIVIVIGIVVALAAILFGVVSKAVDASRRTSCLNKLHALSTALFAYSSDNRGALPGGAMGAPRPPPPPAIPDDDGGRLEDWIWWQSFRLDKVGQGGIGKYMKLSSDPHDLAALQCPADDLARQKLAWAGGRYPFSYVLNGMMASTHNTGGSKMARTVADIKDPQEKILFYEEDPRMMEDGNGDLVPQASPDGLGTELICLRHDGIKASADRLNSGATTPGVPRVPSLTASGNVAFCDGHAGTLTRAEAHSRLHFAPDSGIPPWTAATP